MSKKIQVVLGSTSLEVTPLPLIDYPTELTTKHEIVSVIPIFNSKPVSADEAKWWIYPYSNMTVVDITLSNGSHINLELQDITNQPTWSTGTLAGLNAAVTAIKAWL